LPGKLQAVYQTDLEALQVRALTTSRKEAKEEVFTLPNNISNPAPMGSYANK
jgi:hypothetical protein